MGSTNRQPKTGADVLKMYGVKPVATAPEIQGDPSIEPASGADVLRKYGVKTKTKTFDIPSADEEMKRQFKPSWGETGALALSEGLAANAPGFLHGLLPGNSVKGTNEAISAAYEANPKTALAFNTLGNVTGLGKFVQGPLSAMGMAGAESLLSNKENLDKDGLLNVAEDATGKALTAGVLSKALPVVAKAGSGLMGKVKNALTMLHLKPTMQTAVKQGAEGLGKIAEEVNDSGALKFGAKASETSGRLGDLREELGATMGDMIDNSSKTIKPDEAASFIEKRIAPMEETSLGKSAMVPFRQKLAAFLQHYAPQAEEAGEDAIEPMTAAMISAEKRAAQESLPKGAVDTMTKKAHGAYAGGLRDLEESLVDNPDFGRARDATANIINADKMATRTAGTHGLIGGIADVGIGLEVAREAQGEHPDRAAALALLRALTKGRVASSGAVTAKALQGLLSNSGAQQGLVQAITNMSDRPAVMKKMQGKE